MVKNCLAVGIILLFVGLTYAPVINAIDESRMPKALSIPKKEDTVSITVLEYKADGTVEKSIVKMPCEQWMTYRAEIRNVRDVDTRLSVYKKYNLVPQNVTADTLRLGMEKKIQNIKSEIDGLQKFIINSKSNGFSNDFSDHFLINFRCVIYGWMQVGLRFLGGSSSIIGIINGIIIFIRHDWWNYIKKSIDLFQILFGESGSCITYNGTLPDHDIDGFLYVLFILGFVGYFVIMPPLPNIFLTYDCEYLGHTGACFGFAGTSLIPYPSLVI